MSELTTTKLSVTESFSYWVDVSNLSNLIESLRSLESQISDHELYSNRDIEISLKFGDSIILIKRCVDKIGKIADLLTDNYTEGERVVSIEFPAKLSDGSEVKFHPTTNDGMRKGEIAPPLTLPQIIRSTPPPIMKKSVVKKSRSKRRMK